MGTGNRPAIRPLQHGVAGCRFCMFHHLFCRLPPAPGTNPYMHHVVSVEHFALWQRIHGLQQLAGNAFRLLQRAVR